MLVSFFVGGLGCGPISLPWAQGTWTKKYHQEENKGIGGLLAEGKKNDKEPVKGQEINFLVLTDL